MDDVNPVVPQDENPMEEDASIDTSEEVTDEEELAAEADELDEEEETPEADEESEM